MYLSRRLEGAGGTKGVCFLCLYWRGDCSRLSLAVQGGDAGLCLRRATIGTLMFEHTVVPAEEGWRGSPSYRQPRALLKLRPTLDGQQMLES